MAFSTFSSIPSLYPLLFRLYSLSSHTRVVILLAYIFSISVYRLQLIHNRGQSIPSGNSCDGCVMTSPLSGSASSDNSKKTNPESETKYEKKMYYHCFIFCTFLRKILSIFSYRLPFIQIVFFLIRL